MSADSATTSNLPTNRQHVLATYRQSLPVVAPSLLKCDFANLQREMERLEAAGAPAVHWDVMDGHFVPNLSYGPMVIERLRPVTGMIFDAHLMISRPDKYLDSFLQAGCDCITVHIEADDEPGPLLERIRAADVLAGLALNPGTPVARIEPLLPACDLVLVMSVEPGFGGQKFLPAVLEKLKQLRRWKELGGLLGIDGGIDRTTISSAAEAGADLFVAGSAVFEAADYRTALGELRKAAAGPQNDGTIIENNG